MPVISMFYGLIVSMYFFDTKQHHLPHIHVKYGGEEGIFAIPSAEMIEGTLPKNKIRLVQAWMEIHQEELMANWQLASEGEQVFNIDPLK